MGEADKIEPVVSEPKKTKKKRGRPKGSKAKKKELITPEQVADLLSEVKKLGQKVSAVENAAVVTARGPGAPTRDQRARAEMMPQMPGATQQMLPDERDGRRRKEIYERRELIGRKDQVPMPSGARSTVGTKMRPVDSPDDWRMKNATPEQLEVLKKSLEARRAKGRK